jgi:uncharacterized protein YigE (DUF2233 family)
MRLMILLSIFSLVGCANVQRPDADVCGVNAKTSKLRCYNIKNNYTNDGTLKDGATPTVKPIANLMSLNGGIYFSPADFEKLKVWLQDMRDYAKEHCQ